MKQCPDPPLARGCLVASRCALWQGFGPHTFHYPSLSSNVRPLNVLPMKTWHIDLAARTTRSCGAPTAGHQALSSGTRYIFASPEPGVLSSPA